MKWDVEMGVYNICTSQSPMEDMEDSVESGIRVTKETEK